MSVAPAEKASVVALLESLPIQEVLRAKARLRSVVVIREPGHDGSQWASFKYSGATTQGPLGIELRLDAAPQVDPQAELARLREELPRERAELAASEAKLVNWEFLTRAKPEAVEKERAKEAEFRQKVEGLRQRMSELEGLAATPTQAEGG